MDVSRSDLVQSVAGRDKGMLFYVIDTDGVYVSLANGKERRVERPKRKKEKHVRTEGGAEVMQFLYVRVQHMEVRAVNMIAVTVQRNAQ